MALNPQERQKGNLEHAHWRVEFLLSMLDAHRASSVKTPEWRVKEFEYLHQIAAAQVELDRVEMSAQSVTPEGSRLPRRSGGV